MSREILNKLVVVFFLMSCSILKVNAQFSYVPADSLLKWFRENHPLEAWNLIQDYEKRTPGLQEYDYKAYYKISELKSHLLKLLDRDLYYQKRLEESRESYFPDSQEDSAYIIYRIKGRLKQQKSKISLDTILHSSALFSIYTDSILSEITELQKEEFRKRGKPFPGNQEIYFHMNLAYPESYKKIREFWEETGKGENRNPFFLPLVRMGDAEARSKYDLLITKTIKSNGEDGFFGQAFSNCRSELRGSYGTKKLIEMLEIDQMIDLFGFGDPEDIVSNKCRIIQLLIDDLFAYRIPMNPVIKHDDTCEKHLENLFEIKVAAQKLIQFYKKQEYYWMSNMPFYSN